MENNVNHHAQGQIVSATEPSAQTAMAELPIHVKAMERPTLVDVICALE
jgi:hypothetical protein